MKLFATTAPGPKLMLDVVGRGPLGHIVTNEPTGALGEPITERLPTRIVAVSGICSAVLPLSPLRPVIWNVDVVPAGTFPRTDFKARRVVDDREVFRELNAKLGN